MIPMGHYIIGYSSMSSAIYPKFSRIFFLEQMSRVDHRRKFSGEDPINFKGTQNTQDAIAGHHQNLVIQYFFWCPKKTFRMPLAWHPGGGWIQS